ncbi:hypothetical protein BOQ00_03345 [Campylobacter coli]|nr:hypothetical protein BOQ00_03345 [Campylobacter coli]
MYKKNVVLLGGSNSVMVNGLQKGLRQENIKLTNLALGATTSIQNLYELKRKKNREVIKQADLIITESNINEINHNLYSAQLPINIIYRNLNWLYQELYFLNKKIIVLILPLFHGQWKLINQIHILLANKYKFNIINLCSYYIQNNLQEFSRIVDPIHPNLFIMRELGRNIIQNINFFKLERNYSIKKNDNPIFKIFEPDSNNINIKNSMYDENVSLVSSEKHYFKEDYYGYKIIASHTWCKNISNILIKNNKIIVFKAIINLNNIAEFQDTTFHISKDTFFCSVQEAINFTEPSQGINFKQNNLQTQDTLRLISFFLASPEGNYHTEEINFETLANENIEISNDYNFNHLIPPVELYKEIIDEYCSIMDPRKLTPLQKQITENNDQITTLNNEKQKLINEKSNLQAQINQLQNTLNTLPIKKQQLEISNLEQDLINKKLQTKQLEKQLNVVSNDTMASNGNKITIIYPNSAKSRIQNQLSYKLGQAMIVNSKSLLGYIRMPFVLSYIKDKHKQEQKIYQEKIKKDPSLKLPPLESHPDYKEAIKEKECFTYKLGEALIKASNNWYGGGYIKLWFEIRKLKRDF